MPGSSLRAISSMLAARCRGEGGACSGQEGSADAVALLQALLNRSWAAAPSSLQMPLAQLHLVLLASLEQEG